SDAPSCRRRRGAWSKNLLESGPEHCIRSPFSARRILVCADDGAIDDGPYLVDLELEFAENCRPVVLGCPVGESVVDGLPWPEPLWQVAPWHARLHAKQYGFDEQPVVLRLPPRATPWQERLELSPLFVAQSMTVHGPF